MATPTRAWQEQLLSRLTGNPSNVSSYSTPGSFSPGLSTQSAGPSSIPSASEDSSRTRRRVDYTSEESPTFQPEHQELYIMSDEQSECTLQRCIHYIFHNLEKMNLRILLLRLVDYLWMKTKRYALSDGLCFLNAHLLVRSDTMEMHQDCISWQRASVLTIINNDRVVSGIYVHVIQVYGHCVDIWVVFRKFSRPRPDLSYEDHRDLQTHERSVHVTLPTIEIQLHLVDLYFTYLHPVYPVLHKQDFLASFGQLYVHPLSIHLITAY